MLRIACYELAHDLGSYHVKSSTSNPGTNVISNDSIYPQSIPEYSDGKIGVPGWGQQIQYGMDKGKKIIFSFNSSKAIELARATSFGYMTYSSSPVWPSDYNWRNMWKVLKT